MTAEKVQIVLWSIKELNWTQEYEERGKESKTKREREKEE